MKKSRIKNKSYRIGLLVRTLIVLVIIFCIPIMLLYSLLTQSTTQRVMEDIYAQISTSLQNVADTVDEICSSAETVSNQIKTDSLFNESSFMINMDEEDTYNTYLLMGQISRSLYQYYLNSPYINSLELYNPYCDAVFASKIGTTRSVHHHPPDETIQAILGPEGHGEKQWFWESKSSEKQLVMYFSPYFSNKPTKKLYAKIIISASVLQDRFQRLFPNEDTGLFIYQSDSGLQPVTENASAALDLLEAHLLEGKNGWFASEENDKRFVTVYRYSEHTHWYYIVHAPFESYNSSLSLLNDYFYYFIICLVSILLISLFFIYSQIIRPTQIISSKMREAEGGDFSVRIHIKQKDEIGYIGHRLNALLSNTQELIQENYATRILKNEFELKYIQTQLKEHFIYNTLDTIHWIANKHKVPEISDIIFSLSHFFRLTLNHGKDTISVSDAKEILDCYLSLINVRMDHMVQYTIDVESGLEAVTVIKYPFHPIVENAFQHGIRAKEQGMIHISFAYADAHHIRYSVEDDGIGISKDRLEKIRSTVFSNSDKEADDCFALVNIRHQLELYYHDDYSFNIVSEEGKGTVVTLVFPIEKEQRHEKDDHHR